MLGCRLFLLGGRTPWPAWFASSWSLGWWVYVGYSTVQDSVLEKNNRDFKLGKVGYLLVFNFLFVIRMKPIYLFCIFVF